MILQIASDLHPDPRFGYLLGRPKQAKQVVLVVAGDYSHYRGEVEDFLSELSKVYKAIIFVCGNHEFYGHDIDTRVKELKDALHTLKNVFILDNEQVTLGDVTFIGSTLWSSIPTHERDIVDGVNDFRYIKKFSADESRKRYRKSVGYLNRALAGSKGKTVVVTHFGCHPNSISSKYWGSPINGYFVTNAYDNMAVKPTLWIHGHTHDSFDYKTEEGTRIICNPKGYGFENPNYDTHLLVHL